MNNPRMIASLQFSTAVNGEQTPFCSSHAGTISTRSIAIFRRSDG
jgi:hypothetical protein